MRKLIVSEFVSVDGVMEAPGGEPGYKHTGWVAGFHEPEMLGYKLREVQEAEALLLGRVTFEAFSAAWPQRTDDVGFADKMNAMPKYFVSTTLRSWRWDNSILLVGDPIEAIQGLKDREGGDILVHGSRTLVQTLHEHRLVDEYRLMIFPVVLGSGRRLFPDDASDVAMLQLVDSEAFGTGVVVHTYRPAGER